MENIDELIKAAKAYNNQSEAYAVSVLWGAYSYNYSVYQCADAVELARNDREKIKKVIDKNIDRVHAQLSAYEKLPNGLTPDDIKFSPKYIQLKKEWDYWFAKLKVYNKEEMKIRKANGTKHYIEVHGVKLSRMQELFFAKWITKNNIAMNTLTPEQRTETVNKFLNEKFPK